jgi:hypothetical protein
MKEGDGRFEEEVRGGFGKGQADEGGERLSSFLSVDVLMYLEA